jgi:hypothetical protein
VLLTGLLVLRALSVTCTGAPMRNRRIQSVPSLAAVRVYNSVLDPYWSAAAAGVAPLPITALRVGRPAATAATEARTVRLLVLFMGGSCIIARRPLAAGLSGHDKPGAVVDPSFPLGVTLTSLSRRGEC